MLKKMNIYFFNCYFNKHLLFNKHLIANDGLLINELATKTNCSFQDSESRISLFVEDINLKLKDSKQYQLPKIGVFHLDSEGNINFEQDRYFNFLLNAYGLTSVQFVSKIEVEKIEVEKETDTPIIPIERVKNNFWKWEILDVFFICSTQNFPFYFYFPKI